MTEQDLSEIEAAAAKLEEIEHYLNLWNGMASEPAKFGRNPLRDLIGWRESSAKGNEELFARKLTETLVPLLKILYTDTAPKQEEPATTPDTMVSPTSPTKPFLTADQMFNLLFRRWKEDRATAREVCSAVIEIADRGSWNWKDPKGRMETTRDRSLPYFQGFCEPDAKEVRRTELKEGQRKLFDFICESFFRWYEAEEKAGYPNMDKKPE